MDSLFCVIVLIINRHGEKLTDEFFTVNWPVSSSSDLHRQTPLSYLFCTSYLGNSLFMELLQLDGPGWYLYLVIALTLLGGAFGLPIPEDIPLITTGVLIGNSRLNPVAAWLVCYGSIVVGDLIIFSIGYKVGFAIFKSPLIRSRISSDSVTRLCQKLERHSIGLIILARHLFYMRTITFLVCGALRLRPARFLIIDALAALLSSTIMVGLGFFASEHLTELFDFLTQAKMFSVVLGGIIALALVLFLLRRYRQSSQISD